MNSFLLNSKIIIIIVNLNFMNVRYVLLCLCIHVIVWYYFWSLWSAPITCLAAQKTLHMDTDTGVLYTLD